jgi:hypothetical protein
MRWFRFYGEALDDHKVQSLSPELFKAWVNLLCVASRCDGVLPHIDKLAFSLRVSTHEMQSRIDELVLLGLLDIREDKKLEPHNWPERQFTSDTSVDRTRKYRERLKKKPCDVTVTAEVTPPDTDSEADTERDTPLPPPGAVRVEKPLPKFGRLEALEAFNAYNAVALRCALPQAAKMTPNRERSIVARLKDYGLEGWHKALANIEQSKFLTGGTDTGFRADLDFVCQAKSFGKLHDGGYGNGRHSPKAPAAKPSSTFAHPPKEREEDWKERIANEMWAEEQKWAREHQNAGAVQ